MTIEPHTPPPDDSADPEVPGSGAWPSTAGLAFIVVLVIVAVLLFAEYA